MACCDPLQGLLEERHEACGVETPSALVLVSVCS